MHATEYNSCCLHNYFYYYYVALLLVRVRKASKTNLARSSIRPRNSTSLVLDDKNDDIIKTPEFKAVPSNSSEVVGPRDRPFAYIYWWIPFS